VGHHGRVRPLVLTTAVTLAFGVLAAAPAGARPTVPDAPEPARARLAGTALGQTGGGVACGTAVPAAVVLGAEGPGGATYTPTVNGVLTSFSHLANGTNGQVRAIVFADGATAARKVVTAKSAKVTVTRNQLNTVAVRLPIAAGQHLGLGYTANGMACATPGSAGDRTLVGAPFDPDTSSDFSSIGVLDLGGSQAYRPNISATFEPDADGDGFGDVTQDACPRSALTQVACPDPETSITKRPKRFRENPKVKIRFTSDIAGSTFECSTDGRKFRACASPFKKVLGRGTHTIRIRAVSPAGIKDPKASKVRVTITQ
jgi:hypothetical protein